MLTVCHHLLLPQPTGVSRGGTSGKSDHASSAYTILKEATDACHQSPPGTMVPTPHMARERFSRQKQLPNQHLAMLLDRTTMSYGIQPREQ